MRHPAFILMAIGIVLLNACGKVEYIGKAANGGMMSETDAMQTLADLPLEDVRGARGGRGLSAAGLEQAINDAIASGQVDLPSNVRGATGTGGVDLSALTQILTLLQSGKANSLLGLANGLVNLNGTTGTTGSKLDSLMSLLNSVLPIIMTIAPQYAGIIQAVMTIVPLVLTFINMFKKPKKTASVTLFLPVLA